MRTHSRTTKHACAPTLTPGRWLLTWIDKTGHPDWRETDAHRARIWCLTHGIPFTGGDSEIRSKDYLRRKLAQVGP